MDGIANAQATNHAIDEQIIPIHTWNKPMASKGFGITAGAAAMAICFL